MVLALNMYDIAQRQGLRIDLEKLQAELGVPIVTTVATRKRGIDELMAQVDADPAADPVRRQAAGIEPDATEIRAPPRGRADHARLRAPPERPDTLTGKIDACCCTRSPGLVILLAMLFVMFQAVFTWATPLMDGIEASSGASAAWSAP
jgi:ferrous iron transport protein B